MSKEIIKDGSASILSNYAKRFLEKKYDKLFESDTGKKLKELNLETKYVIEFLLYALASVADKQLSEGSPLKKFVKEVVSDVAPEIAKRLINGDAEYSASKKILPGSNELMDYLSEISEEDLSKIISALKNTQESERGEILKNLLLKTKVDLKKTSAAEPGKSFSDKVEDNLKFLNKRMKNYIDKRKEKENVS
jgi:hypothetical protein